jgi:hypothetical protein
VATTLSVTSLRRDALVALGTPPAGDITGNLIPNGGSTFIYVECSTTPRTVTVDFARGVDGVLPPARSFNLTANYKGFLLLGSPQDYGQVTKITPSHAEVLVKAFQVP